MKSSSIFHGLMSFESRFLIPNTPMKKPEYLSRGSAILLENKKNDTTSTVGVVTSTHIAYPFYTPYYFQNEMSWLGKIKPQHCSFYVSIYGEDGPIWEMELERDMLKLHETLDVCLFQVPESESNFFLTQLDKLSPDSIVKPKPFLNNSFFPIGKHSNITCLGYDFSEDTNKDFVQESRLKVVNGRILSKNIETALRRKINTDGSEIIKMEEIKVETEEKLKFGMCGGPVVLNHDSSNLIGIIEGINPVDGTVHCLPSKTLWELFD